MNSQNIQNISYNGGWYGSLIYKADCVCCLHVLCDSWFPIFCFFV